MSPLIAILGAIAYFVLLFGTFEVMFFRRGIAYWQRPIIVSIYFLAGTVVALALFSNEPFRLLLQTPPEGVFAVVVLYLVLCFLAWRGYFTFSGSALHASRSTRYESLRYVFAKTFDILFQDTLVVIVALLMYAYIGDVTWSLFAFSVYFFVAHSLLATVLPLKFALIFTVASFFAGLSFGTIVLFGLPVVYIFILHWLFYAATYTLIQRVRKEVLPLPVYNQLYGFFR